MQLAIFDLDNTLLAGDSDYEWGQFIVDKGLRDRDEYTRQNKDFYAQYEAGTLDIFEFLEFSLGPLAEVEPARLTRWHEEFMNTRIKPLILDAGRSLIESHRSKGHELMIITATNAFVTRPIAEELGIEALIACEPEQIDGRYTGRLSGIPSFQSGKIERLEQWLAERNQQPKESWFYSDSINDLPLLERVDHPVAVDPDARLRVEAEVRGWPIRTLREPSADKAADPSRNP